MRKSLSRRQVRGMRRRRKKEAFQSLHLPLPSVRGYMSSSTYTQQHSSRPAVGEVTQVGA
jgi:hypothetical protein